MDRLKDKVAIVTGGGSGIGRAASILFAEEGAKVIVSDWVADKGEETVRTINAAGGEAIFTKTNVSKSKDCQGMVREAVDSYGRLNILFSNAGILGWEGVPLADCTEGKFDEVISINLKGVFLGMKYAIPEMIKTGGGSIVNIASHVVDRCLYNFCGYTASKAGVIGLSRQAAADYITKNVRVNCILPGFIRTPMLENFMQGSHEVEQQLLSLQPIGRFGSPNEIAKVAVFLASDEASYITGAEIPVEGGFNRLGRA